MASQPELIMVDEQVVAYEVEIDSFDVKYDEEEHDGQGTQDEPFSHGTEQFYAEKFQNSKK